MSLLFAACIRDGDEIFTCYAGQLIVSIPMRQLWQPVLAMVDKDRGRVRIFSWKPRSLSSSTTQMSI